MESNHACNIRPPLSGWLGGKRLLAKQIINRIPEHICYAEPFAGAAWVLFKKPPSESEVLNDWSGEIANLYRVVKSHPVEFYRQFDGALAGREEFTRLLTTPVGVLTDIQRAARYYFIHKCAFGGRMGGRPTYGYSAVRPPKFDVSRIEADILAAHRRLQRVYIENLHYSEILNRYDRRETFFYLDPPVLGV